MDSTAPPTRPAGLPACTYGSPLRVVAVRPDRFFGYPDEALVGTWTVNDLCAFLHVSERKARELMKTAGAPSPLRAGSNRCDRWNPYQVVAWLHGDPGAASPAGALPDAPVADRAGTAPEATAHRSRAGPPPGRAWAPAVGR